MSDEQTFDLVSLKPDLETGKLSIPDFLVKIDKKFLVADRNRQEAQKLVKVARNTGGDILGLGSKGRCNVLASALEHSNNAISQTHEIMRDVIMLTVCSARITCDLIQSSTDLLQGRLKDANGQIIHVSQQTEKFLKTAVLPLAIGLKASENQLKEKMENVRQELMSLVEEEATHNHNAIDEQKCILDKHDTALETTREQLHQIFETDVEQDLELKRQAEKDLEHDLKLADNAKHINANAKAISSMKEMLKNHHRFMENVKTGAGIWNISALCSILSLLCSIGVLFFVWLRM